MQKKKKFFVLVSLVISLLSYVNFLIALEEGYEYFWHLSNQVMMSRALYVAADLELADHLNEPCTIEELADKTNSHASTLERLMRFLIAHGVFTRDQDGVYYNNELSLYIQKDHPLTMRPFLLHDDPTRWNALGNLEYCIKTGQQSFDHLYQESYFAHLAHNATLSQRFDEAMTIISQKESTLIAQNIHFEGVVADIGGGKGMLLEEIKKHNSLITDLILFDLAQVIENLGEKKELMTCVAGSFFDTIAVKADVFLLKRILHDWDDVQALRILQNIAAAMTENTVLYIIDAVIDQCQDQKLILDIDLRLLTIFGGKERTMKEFTTLCDQAGLEIVSVQELTSIIDAIKCKKK